MPIPRPIADLAAGLRRLCRLRRLHHPLPQRLEPRGVYGLNLAAAACVRVDCGRLWITVAGQSQDHFVGRGYALVLPPGRRIVLECDSAESAVLQWACGAAPRLEAADATVAGGGARGPAAPA